MEPENDTMKFQIPSIPCSLKLRMTSKTCHLALNCLCCHQALKCLGCYGVFLTASVAMELQTISVVKSILLLCNSQDPITSHESTRRPFH